MAQPSYRIPFNRACLAGRELEYVAHAASSGCVSGDGQFTKRCHEFLQKEIGVRRALLTTSCTHALEMAALLLRVGPGDEVIVPSYTFVSTVNAFVLRGARPIFADVRPDTLNLDETLLPGLITDRTRAIVAVHYAGVGCEMDSILQTAQARGVPVVEDNAHGLFGRYRGRKLGTFGCLATQSFHETKNITCGEGGALLINDDALVDRAEIIREKGTNRSRFFRGEVDKYGWVDLGSSYLPSELLAAFLLGQLERFEHIQATRRAVWFEYECRLADWAASQGARLPVVPPYCEHPSHLFYILTPSLAFRSALIAHLKAEGILSVFHYLPLHLSTVGRSLGGFEGQCPVAEDVSERLLRLPLYNSMTMAEVDDVVDAVTCFPSAGRPGH